MRPPLLDINETAALLGTTVRHVRHLVETRRIPHTKVGVKLRFSPTAIDAWLAANTVEVTA